MTTISLNFWAQLPVGDAPLVGAAAVQPHGASGGLCKQLIGTVARITS